MWYHEWNEYKHIFLYFGTDSIWFLIFFHQSIVFEVYASPFSSLWTVSFTLRTDYTRKRLLNLVRSIFQMHVFTINSQPSSRVSVFSIGQKQNQCEWERKDLFIAIHRAYFAVLHGRTELSETFFLVQSVKSDVKSSEQTEWRRVLKW